MNEARLRVLQEREDYVQVGARMQLNILFT